MKKSYLFLIIFVLHLAFLQAQSLDTPIYTKDVNIPAYYAVKKTMFLLTGMKENVIN